MRWFAMERALLSNMVTPMPEQWWWGLPWVMLVFAYMTGFLTPALLALGAARTSSLAGFMFVGNALALPVHDPDNPIAHYRSGLHGRLPLMSTWLGYAGASQMPATRWRQGGVVSSLVMPWDVQLVINVFKGAGGGCINMLWTALEERCCDQKMLLR